MRRWGYWLASLLLVGCGEDSTPCGGGEAARIDGQAVCIFAQGHGIIENGFRCPPGRGEPRGMHDADGNEVVVCSDEPIDPDAFSGNPPAPLPEGEPMEMPPKPEPQPEPQPEMSEPEPQPEMSEPEAFPGSEEGRWTPDPVGEVWREAPPWVCPEEGRRFYAIGACVLRDGAVVPGAEVDLRVNDSGFILPAEHPCYRAQQTTLGRLGPQPQWIEGTDIDGSTWFVAFELPFTPRGTFGRVFLPGDALTIDVQSQIGGLLDQDRDGTLAISDANGLKALIHVNTAAFEPVVREEITVSRGAQSCEIELDGCRYTGHLLEANVDGQVTPLRASEVGQNGPFHVVNGGQLELRDCGGGPEDSSFAVWRR